MHILTYRIIGAELISVSPIKKNIAKSEDIWDCMPVYEIKRNEEGVIIQTVTITLIRKREFKEVTMVTKTSFEVELENENEIYPTTPKDFEFFVLISHMAFAHTRVYFLIEMQGTIFEGGLLPQDTNDAMLQKVKWGLSLKDRDN